MHELLKIFRLTQRTELTVELELLVGPELLQSRAELAAKDCGERLNGKEEVRHWQQSLLLVFEPAVSCLALAERAMAVAAGVRHEMALAALLAAVAMTAQGERTASQERTQDLPMVRGQLQRGHLQTEA